MALRRRRTDEDTCGEPRDDPEPQSDDFIRLVDREWMRLAHPGTWFTGTERIAIAAEARRAVQDRPPTDELPAATVEAARTVAVAAATIRPGHIERWAAAGLHRFAYVELVGIVSRLMALDVAAFGLGREERALPSPARGEPTRRRPDKAQRTNGWVPTVGPVSAPSSLSAVPAEHRAMFDLHGVLYLSMAEMGDLEIVRDGLERAQIELVAARTSTLNECVY